jgi:hypothetical protein
MGRLVKLFVAVLLSLSLIACTTTRAVAARDVRSGQVQIDAGDRVRVQRTDGSVLAFRVSAVTPDGLRGPDLAVGWDEIAELEVTEFSAGKTTAAGVAGAAGTYALAMALVAAMGAAVVWGMREAFEDDDEE